MPIWLQLNKLPIKQPLPPQPLNPTSQAVDPTRAATAVVAAHPDTAQHSRLHPTAMEALHLQLATEVHPEDPAIENMDEEDSHHHRDFIFPF